MRRIVAVASLLLCCLFVQAQATNIKQANQWRAVGKIASLSMEKLEMVRGNGKKVEVKADKRTEYAIDGRKLKADAFFARAERGHEVVLIYNYDTKTANGVYVFIDAELPAVGLEEGPLGGR